jgi:hypothetical protein
VFEAELAAIDADDAEDEAVGVGEDAATLFAKAAKFEDEFDDGIAALAAGVNFFLEVDDDKLVDDTEGDTDVKLVDAANWALAPVDCDFGKGSEPDAEEGVETGTFSRELGDADDIKDELTETGVESEVFVEFSEPTGAGTDDMMVADGVSALDDTEADDAGETAEIAAAVFAAAAAKSLATSEVGCDDEVDDGEEGEDACWEAGCGVEGIPPVND